MVESDRPHRTIYYGAEKKNAICMKDN